MRLAVLLCLAAMPVNAETVVVPATITTATVFAEGASVTRRVAFDLPAGEHLIRVPVGASGDVQAWFISGTEAADVLAVTLATDRPPATGTERPDEVAAAAAEVERLEAVVRQRESGVAAIRARAEAAVARIGYLGRLGSAEGQPGDAAALAAIGRMVADETLAARQEALAAEVEAAAADTALKGDREALAEARKALAAVSGDSSEDGLLSLTISKAADGAGWIELTSLHDEAHWVPVYDMRLTRGQTAELVADRAVMVEQSTGEDWLGVDLTFSTASLAAQMDPSSIWPQHARIEPKGSEGDYSEGGGYSPVIVEPEVIVEDSSFATARFVGSTLTYHYPGKVDLRSGADLVRLALDSVTISADVGAVAVPLSDETAYMVAEITNDTGEILLPGQALLWLDGAMVGTKDFPQLASGAKAEIGFGPIHGLVLKRVVPDRTAGDRGMFSTSTEKSETAVVTVENLTAESWPVRLLDGVPYSEQDDLRIEWSADPAPDETDVDGSRGVLAWEFTVEPGTTKKIEIRQRLRWPSGYALQ